VRPLIGFETFAEGELIATDGPDEIRALCDDCTVLMPARLPSSAARGVPDPAPVMPGPITPDARAVAGFSLASPPAGFVALPYPWYHALRTHSPVHALGPDSVLLTRYEDVLAVYRSPDVSSDKQVEFAPKLGAGSPLYEHHTTSLVFSDPPLHTRVRRILMGALNQRAIARMEAGLVTLVADLLDRLADARRARPDRALRGADPGRGDRQPAGGAARRTRRRCATGRWPSCRRWSRRRRRTCWRGATPRSTTSCPTCAT
jgi:hypothetical protein